MESPTAAVILAQRLRGVLSAGKLDFAFGLGRHSVAGCGTISPRAHGLQNMTITRDSRALQNERSVNAPVDSDDEADFYSTAVGCRGEKWIRRGEGLGRANILAGRLQSDVWQIDELGGAGQRFRDLAFSQRKCCQSRTRRRCSDGQCSQRQHRQQSRRPEATEDPIFCLVHNPFLGANTGPLKRMSMLLPCSRLRERVR
jgi:hypothetical protein